jgi:gliding motility-associated-like protein
VAATNDFCPGLSLEIVAQVQNGDPLGHYQWEWNGAPAGPDSSIFTNAGYQNGDSVYCLYSDSSSCSPVPTKSNILVIEVKTLPLVSTSPVDTLVQAGSSIELNGIVNQDSVSNYEWEPIGSVSSPHSFSTLTTPVESATTYYFNVSTTDGCQVTKTVTIGLLYTFAMPTAFTPNGDGINDIYRIPPRTNLILQEFDVFNRWGDRVFTTQNISTGWDGTWKGIKQDVGIYFYFIRGQTDQAQVISRGSLILIR